MGNETVQTKKFKHLQKYKRNKKLTRIEVSEKLIKKPNYRRAYG